MSGGENLLCFVDRSDPGLGGLCGNMDRGHISLGGKRLWRGGGKKEQGIRQSPNVKRSQAETRKIERNVCCSSSGPSHKKRIIAANALCAKGGGYAVAAGTPDGVCGASKYFGKLWPGDREWDSFLIIYFSLCFINVFKCLVLVLVSDANDIVSPT